MHVQILRIYNDIQFPSWHLTCLYCNLTFTFNVPTHSEPLSLRHTWKNVPMKHKKIHWFKRASAYPINIPKKREKMPTMPGNLGKIFPKSLELRLAGLSLPQNNLWIHHFLWHVATSGCQFKLVTLPNYDWINQPLPRETFWAQPVVGHFTLPGHHQTKAISASLPSLTPLAPDILECCMQIRFQNSNKISCVQLYIYSIHEVDVVILQPKKNIIFCFLIWVPTMM